MTKFLNFKEAIKTLKVGETITSKNGYVVKKNFDGTITAPLEAYEDVFKESKIENMSEVLSFNIDKLITAIENENIDVDLVYDIMNENDLLLQVIKNSLTINNADAYTEDLLKLSNDFKANFDNLENEHGTEDLIVLKYLIKSLNILAY